MELKFKENMTLLPIIFVCLLMVILYFVEIKFGIDHLFFPEIAALSFGVLSRKKTWHLEKSALLLSPIACGSLGVFLSKYFGANFLTLSICLVGGLVLLRIFNTSITPSISAGLFAVLFKIDTISYILNIFLLSIVLLLMNQILNNLEGRFNQDLREASDRQNKFKYGLFLIVIIYAGFAFISQKYYIPELILPPIFIMAIEECSETRLSYPIETLKFSFLIAIISYFIFSLKSFLGVGPLVILLSTLSSFLVFRILKFQAPPLIALALLPLILDRYSLLSPLITSLGFAFIMLSLYVFRKIFLNAEI